MSNRKWKKLARKTEPPKWTFTTEMMAGFFVISVYRGERCYAEQFFKESAYPPIFGKFQFLKGMFK